MVIKDDFIWLLFLDVLKELVKLLREVLDVGHGFDLLLLQAIHWVLGQDAESSSDEISVVLQGF